VKGFSILIWILAAQVFTIFTLLIWIVSHRIKLYIQNKSTANRKAILSDYILNLLNTHAHFSLEKYPGKRSWRKHLLEVIEEFDRRIEGEEWRALSKEMSAALLIDEARNRLRSLFWVERNFASRVFAITFFPEDEESILHLMNDPIFLVQAPAAIAAVRLESRKGIAKMLSEMSERQGFPIFFYRDALLQSSKNAVSILMELSSSPELHQAALDILSGKSWPIPIPFLEQDLESEDPKILLSALQVLLRNPLPDSLPYFIKAVRHPLEPIRLAGMKGFELFPSEETWELLEQLLKDPVWFVRIEAAKILKKRGERGLEILKKQKDSPAREAASYAVVFP
jgi:hypothetical protein